MREYANITPSMLPHLELNRLGVHTHTHTAEDTHTKFLFTHTREVSVEMHLATQFTIRLFKTNYSVELAPPGRNN